MYYDLDNNKTFEAVTLMIFDDWGFRDRNGNFRFHNKDIRFERMLRHKNELMRKMNWTEEQLKQQYQIVYNIIVENIISETVQNPVEYVPSVSTVGA